MSVASRTHRCKSLRHHQTFKRYTMNDLNVIARQNAKAVEAEIPKAVAQGHHVLAKYAVPDISSPPW